MNAQGCFWAMVGGFALGIFRLLVDTPVSMGFGRFAAGYAPGSFLWVINNINFQYFSIVITAVSAVIMVGVSFMTAEPDYGRITNLTFATTTDDDRARTRSSWSKGDVFGSIVVLAGIAFAYIYFRG
jgi:SSS family solute:Na+ symporter